MLTYLTQACHQCHPAFHPYLEGEECRLYLKACRLDFHLCQMDKVEVRHRICLSRLRLVACKADFYRAFKEYRMGDLVRDLVLGRRSSARRLGWRRGGEMGSIWSCLGAFKLQNRKTVSMSDAAGSRDWH